MNKWRDYFGSQEEWDTHAKQFENNDFRQLYDWGEYLKSTGVNIERLAVSSNDKIHISVQYTIRKIWPFCLIYLPSGINGSANEFSSLVKSLRKRYKKYFIYIRIDIREQNNSELAKCITNLNFKKTIYSIRSRGHMLVNLSNETNEIISNAKHKWRYNYRKAIKKEIFIETKTTINPDQIFELCMELSKFKNIRYMYNLKELQMFEKHLNRYTHTTLAFNKEKKLVGCYICIKYNSKAYQIFNAVNKSGNELMAGYTILISVINELKKIGLKQLDMGEINKKRYPGNYQFKKSFNQNNINLEGEYEWSSNFLFKFLVNTYMFIVKA